MRRWTGPGVPFRHRGFTLMEMMIVVVILGVLVTIAYPSYQEQVRKSRRGDAKQALLDAASRQEQYILDHSTYTADMEELGYAEDPAVSEEGYYTVDAAACAGGTIARCYTLTASPVAGTSQASDAGCTSFVVQSTGARSATGTQANDCW